MIKPYEDSAPRQEQVNRMFDGIARRYDLLNRILSLGIDRRWRKKAVRTVASKNPRTILDMSTGTGDLAFMMARVIPGVQITGVDPSEKMLEIAESKAVRQGMGRHVSFRRGEAENIPFDDNTFDGATVSFGVRNFHDIPAGIGELARILRKGGMLTVIEFSTPRGKLFGALYRFYFHRVLPAVGGIISGDRGAYTYLPSSVDHFPPPEEFIGIMKTAGFEDCRQRKLTGGVAYIYTGIKKFTK